MAGQTRTTAELAAEIAPLDGRAGFTAGVHMAGPWAVAINALQVTAVSGTYPDALTRLVRAPRLDALAELHAVFLVGGLQAAEAVLRTRPGSLWDGP